MSDDEFTRLTDTLGELLRWHKDATIQLRYYFDNLSTSGESNE